MRYSVICFDLPISRPHHKCFLYFLSKVPLTGPVSKHWRSSLRLWPTPIKLVLRQPLPSAQSRSAISSFVSVASLHVDVTVLEFPAFSLPRQPLDASSVGVSFVLPQWALSTGHELSCGSLSKQVLQEPLASNHHQLWWIVWKNSWECKRQWLPLLMFSARSLGARGHCHFSIYEQWLHCHL